MVVSSSAPQPLHAYSHSRRRHRFFGFVCLITCDAAEATAARRLQGSVGQKPFRGQAQETPFSQKCNTGGDEFAQSPALRGAGPGAFDS